ncbi:MAG: 16S rRNA (guanine(966)-N(2))-methyltransferase RsmD [Vampirovibrionales bacterium]
MGSLIITGGTLKGRRIEALPQPKQGPCPTRPTTSRVRESVMGILAPDLGACRFLDAFAGTGIMGFEALSRGAEHVLAIEKNPQAIRQIAQNIKKLSLHPPHYTVLKDSLETLWQKTNPNNAYHVAYLDPPYATYLEKASKGLPQNALKWNILLPLALQNQWLTPQCRVLFEHPPQWQPTIDGWLIADQRHYGDTWVSFLTPC